MTRETRIGLLVGLVFIVMFGLVLSELTGNPRMPRQASADATAGESQGAPLLRLTEPPRSPLAARTRTEAENDRPRGARRTGVAEVQLRRPQAHLRGVARTRMLPRRAEQAPAARRSAPPAGGRGGFRRYRVASNDSLIKIAKKVYGPDHGGEYKRIYAANRDVLPDENTVPIGAELKIPPLPGRAPAAGRERPAPRRRRRPRREGRPDAVREMDLDGVRQYVGSAAGASRTWTVRRGDNLSKIAREVFGDERRENVMRIYNANRDKLESPHRLPVGVELSLPS